MVDIFIIFRVQHYFWVQILAFSGQQWYFYYISGTPVQIKKSALNGNKRKMGGFRGAQSVEKGVLG